MTFFVIGLTAIILDTAYVSFTPNKEE